MSDGLASLKRLLAKSEDENTRLREEMREQSRQLMEQIGQLLTQVAKQNDRIAELLVIVERRKQGKRKDKEKGEPEPPPDLTAEQRAAFENELPDAVEPAAVAGVRRQPPGLPDLRQGHDPACRGPAASDAERVRVAREVGARASGRGGERGEGLKRGKDAQRDRRGVSGAGGVYENRGFRGLAPGADGAKRACAKASARGVAVG